MTPPRASARVVTGAKTIRSKGGTQNNCIDATFCALTQQCLRWVGLLTLNLNLGAFMNQPILCLDPDTLLTPIDDARRVGKSLSDAYKSKHPFPYGCYDNFSESDS